MHSHGGRSGHSSCDEVQQTTCPGRVRCAATVPCIARAACGAGAPMAVRVASGATGTSKHANMTRIRVLIWTPATTLAPPPAPPMSLPIRHRPAIQIAIQIAISRATGKLA